MREFELLQHVFAANAELPARVVIPPGDDMGAIRLGGATLLVTVDQIADGVHVEVASTSLEKIGRKAITRNLSDVAAMAARPVAAVAAASLPRDFGERNATALFDAMRITAANFDCPLVGGDVSIWDHPLLLSVTIFAEPFADVAPVLRTGARPGDSIYVSGQLGGSLLTLADDSDHPAMGERNGYAGYTHHLDFTPRLELARTLASDPQLRPHCMIDLSDGLMSDLRHLCNAAGANEPRPSGSGCTASGPLPDGRGSLERGIGDGSGPRLSGIPGAQVDIDRLPIAKAAALRARQTGRPVWEHAVCDGEDYELLFTHPSDALPQRVADVELTRIGVIVERRDAAAPVVMLQQAGATVTPAAQAWEHHG